MNSNPTPLLRVQVGLAKASTEKATEPSLMDKWRAVVDEVRGAEDQQLNHVWLGPVHSLFAASCPLSFRVHPQLQGEKRVCVRERVLNVRVCGACVSVFACGVCSVYSA